MIYINRKRSDLYKNYLENINKYDLTYIVSYDKPTGTQYFLDDYDIFYYNPKKITSEIAIDLLKQSIQEKGHYSIGLVHAELLTIKELNKIRDIPNLAVDIYAIFSDEHNNIYHTSNYLYKERAKKEE